MYGKQMEMMNAFAGVKDSKKVKTGISQRPRAVDKNLDDKKLIQRLIRMDISWQEYKRRRGMAIVNSLF